MMAPLEPCQAVIVEGAIKMKDETEYKNRTLCIHKQIACLHRSISVIIKLFFSNPQVSIKKIVDYSTKMDKEIYEVEQWKEWGQGLKQTEELRYFINYLANDLSILPEIIKAYLWKNNGALKQTIVTVPAKGLLVTH